MFCRLCFHLGCCMAGIAVCACVGLAESGGGGITDIAWTLGPNLPEFRKGGCSTVVSGRVISVFGMRQPWGEMATMYVYDPRTDWWSRAADGPLGQTYVQGTECGDAFYAIGGRSREKGGVHAECYRLRWKDDKYQWDQAAILNEKRAWAPSVSVAGKLYVLGGSQGGRGPTLNSVETLDTGGTTAKWQKVSSIPGASRGWCGAAAVRSKIYLIGGAHFFRPKREGGPDRKRLSQVWQYDPTTNRWKSSRPLPFRLSGFDCCVYRDRFIIVVGGAAESEDFTTEMRRIEQEDRFPSVLLLPVRASLRRRDRPLAPHEPPCCRCRRMTSAS